MPARQPISLWMEQADTPAPPRAALAGSLEVDVAIVGAGYTGLWTAYYLKLQAPALRIAVLEAEYVGFGASGRNGGWLLGGLLGEERLLADLPAERRHAAFELLHGIPDEVATVLLREGIACDYRKGGVLHCAARYPEQVGRLRTWLDALHRLGLSEADYRWLTPAELNRQLRLNGSLGAIYSPHCATLQPARLVSGLALAVERLGVRLFEQSRVSHWQPGLLRTAQGELRADWIVPAVEGYAVGLPPLGDRPTTGGRLSRYQLPVQSLMIATEPLPRALWHEIGLDRGQAFAEFSRQVTYGQRSADDRLVFGARGGYRFGGRLRQDFALDDKEIGLRRELLGELFPQLRNVEISHAWGGNLGMARRFQPHMLLDRESRIALAGGYGGEGVGASNLAGRTLADLILGRASPLTEQPWVLAGRPPTSLRAWEPEPWRWLGYNAIAGSFRHEDRVLANPRSPAWRRALAARLADFMERLMS